MFCLIIAAASMLASSAVQAISVQLDVVPSIAVGETFNVDVIVNDVFVGKDGFEEALAFGFDVTISDSSIVSLIGVSVASPFDDDSAFFPNTDVAGSVFPGIANDGLNDSLLLATLTFQALLPGNLSLGIVSDLLDLNEGLIYFLDAPVDITATTSLTVVPLPAPVWLFGSGLLGLVGIARRKKTE